MKCILFVLGVIAAVTVLNTSTQAQNYPWCANYGSIELRVCDPSAMPSHRDRYGRVL